MAREHQQRGREEQGQSGEIYNKMKVMCGGDALQTRGLEFDARYVPFSIILSCTITTRLDIVSKPTYMDKCLWLTKMHIMNSPPNSSSVPETHQTLLLL